MSAQPTAPTPPRRDRSKPIIMHRVPTPEVQEAWFTGGEATSACGLSLAPMRPGMYRWATETGRVIPEDCPDCFPEEGGSTRSR